MSFKSQRRIGIFDSGLGGLTVVRALLKRYPDASFIYLGDTARVPYGNRSPQTICQYAKEDVSFLVQRGVTDVVVACNTVSAYALPSLREDFPDVHFFDVIEPAIQRVIESEASRVGVIGTRATIQSDVYRQGMKSRSSKTEVISVACPLLVPLVEEGWINKPETKKIIRRYLAPLKQKQIQALVLGCTHYPLLEKAIRASLQKRVKIIDSPSALLDALQAKHPELTQAIDDDQRRQEYFFTDISERTRELVKQWLGKDVTLTKATLEEVS